MKTRILFALSLLALSMTAIAQPDATISTDKDKSSYSLGVTIGKQIKDSLTKQSIDVAPAAFSQGVGDVIQGHSLKMTDEAIDGEVKKLQTAAIQQEEASVQKAALKDRAALLDGNGYPVAGNAKGDITIVEFFDYRCPFCIRMQPTVDALLKTDKNVRIIYRDFPILGPASQAAAQLALMANTQGKYQSVHESLMDLQGKITKEALLSISQKTGLKIDSIEKILTDKPSLKKLMSTAELARGMNLKYTPGFFIAATPGTAAANRKDAPLLYFSGVKTEAEIQAMIASIRKGA